MADRDGQPCFHNLDQDRGMAMCVLCGMSVTKVHWTEQQTVRRALDAELHQTDSSAEPGSKEAGLMQRDRQRERYRRTKLMNNILECYGLRVDDWNGNKYILRDKKGRSLIAQDLGDLWEAAAQLAGRPLDPLDPRFIQWMKENVAARGR